MTTIEFLKATIPNVATNIASNKWFGNNTINEIANILDRYFDEFDISTPLRKAHFIAQVAHESAGFLYTEEIASGAKYEGRKDLGNTQKGDGVKFKGRGLIQLTGRSNYQRYKQFCGYDVVSKPTLLSQPVGAIRSAMWFWQTHGLNELADADSFLAITKRINGGTNGLESRRKFLNNAKKALKLI